MSIKAVSIKMVAEAAGVSPATVSNAMNGKSSVAPDLVLRVRAAAERLGYAADNHASRLRSGRRALAGVVVPDLGNPVFGAFVSTLEHAARRDGFDLLVVSSANDPAEEASRLRAIRSWRPAGLIVIPCDGALKARLPQGEMPPIVVADRIPDDGDFDLVAVDNARAAGVVAGQLAAAGYPDCLVAASTLAISNIRERWDGACAAADAMAMTILECGVEPVACRAILLARLSAVPRPTALFALDNRTAFAAYGAMAELAVGRDIAFASFDEAEWMRLVSPAVTAVCQPVEAMAEAAWRQLRLRMEGAADPPTTRRLACAVEIRGSTLPASPSREAGARAR